MKATAQMGGLTREDIAALKESADNELNFWRTMYHQKFSALCDLALQAIDREWIPMSGYAEARARFGGEGIRIEGYVKFVYSTSDNKWLVFPLPSERP